MSLTSSPFLTKRILFGTAIIASLMIGAGLLLVPRLFSGDEAPITDIAPGDVTAVVSFDITALRKELTQALASNSSASILPVVAEELGTKPEALEDYMKSVQRVHMLIGGGNFLESQSIPDIAVILQGPSGEATRSFLNDVAKTEIMEIEELPDSAIPSFRLGFSGIYLSFLDRTVVASTSQGFMERLIARVDRNTRVRDGSSLGDHLAESGIPEDARRPEETVAWQYINIPTLHAQLEPYDRFMSDVYFGAGDFGPLVAFHNGNGICAYMPMTKDNPWRALFTASDFRHTAPRTLSAVSDSPRPVFSLSLGAGDIHQFMLDYGMRLLRLQGKNAPGNNRSGSVLSSLGLNRGAINDLGVVVFVAQLAIGAVEKTIGLSLQDLLLNMREVSVSIMPFEPGIEPLISLATGAVVTARMANASALDTVRSPITGQPLFPTIPDQAGFRTATLPIPGVPLPLMLMLKEDRFAAAMNPAVARRALEEPQPDSSSDAVQSTFALASMDMASLARLGMESVLNGANPRSIPEPILELAKKLAATAPQDIASLPYVTGNLWIDEIGLNYRDDVPVALAGKAFAGLYSEYSGQALARLKEERLKAEAFASSFAEGKQRYEAKEYDVAVASFRKALSVPGYEQNVEAARLLRDAEASSFLDEGRRLLATKEYDAAVNAFQRAADMSGDEGGEEVALLQEAKTEGERLRREAAEEAARLRREAEAEALRLREEAQKAQQAEDFASSLAEGKQLYETGKYAGSVDALRHALNIPGFADNTEAAGFLRNAEEKNRNALIFTSAMDEGKRFREQKNFEGAIAAFRKALQIPEYANSADAKSRLQESEKAKQNASAFAAALAEGKRLHAAKQFAAASEALRKALAVPGYENNGEAQLLLREVDFTAAINEGMREYQAQNYAVSFAAFKRALAVPGYERHEAVLRLSRDAEFATTLTDGMRQVQAQKHHEAIASFRKALEVPGYEQHDVGWQWLTHAVTAAPIPANMPERIAVDCGMGVALELARIPAGSFIMGSPKGEKPFRNVSDNANEEQQHPVIISRPFYMGIFPVTQEQFETIMGVNPSEFKGRVDSLRRPVETVSWNDAQEFCRRLSQKTGMDMRLPTEAEWEYTCRAGITMPYHTGVKLTTAQANFNGGYQSSRGETTTVDTFLPNAWGLYDMHGNVWEWCSDLAETRAGYVSDQHYYFPLIEYSSDSVIDPLGRTSGDMHIYRGGSWSSDAGFCRSASRAAHRSHIRNSNIGFRVAITFSTTALGQVQLAAAPATPESLFAVPQFATPPSATPQQPPQPQSAQASLPTPPSQTTTPAAPQAAVATPAPAPAQTQSAAQYRAAFSAAMTEGQQKHNAGDYNGAVAAFQQALQIPGFRESPEARRWIQESQSTAQNLAQRQGQYFAAMEAGKGRFNAGDHAQAVNAFKQVLLIPGYSSDQEAMQWLSRAQAAVDNQRQYTDAMEEGARLYQRSRDYDGARAAFARALSVPGYGNSREAREWMGRIQQDMNEAAQNQRRYSSLMAEGQQSLQQAQSQFLGINSRRYFDEALSSFQNAMRVPGYERDENARRFVGETQDAIRRMESNRSQGNPVEINPLQLLFGRQ